MKIRIYLVVLLAFFGLSGANGQVIQDNNYFKSEFGVKVGLNYQMVAGSPWTPTLNSGIQAGVYKDFSRGKDGWRIELNFTEAHYVTVNSASYVPGYKVQPSHPSDWDITSKGDFNAIYLRIPVLAQFRIYKALHFVVGPEVSQQITITDNNGAFSKDFGSAGLSNIFMKTELMGTVGIEGKMKQRINLGIRMSLGLNSINKGASTAPNNFRTYDGWKLWSVQGTFGFRLKGNYQ